MGTHGGGGMNMFELKANWKEEKEGDKKLLLVIVFDIMFQVVIYNKIMAAYTHL